MYVKQRELINKTGAFGKKAIMSPPTCHWMETIVFVRKMRSIN